MLVPGRGPNVKMGMFRAEHYGDCQKWFALRLRLGLLKNCFRDSLHKMMEHPPYAMHVGLL